MDRFTGDGFLLPNDITLLRQFIVGNLAPNSAFNELQRADCSPKATSGDGHIDVTDAIQARRYVAGLDAPQPADGPIMVSAAPAEPFGGTVFSGTDRGRTLKVVSTNSLVGRKVIVPLEFNSIGNEMGMSFTLHFDPTKLTSPIVTLSSDAASSVVLTTGRNEMGDLTVLMDSSEPISSLSTQIMTVTFDVADDAPEGATFLTFGNYPTSSAISDADANLLHAKYEPGAVIITRSDSSGVTASGRVLTPDGRGLRNAQVTMIDQNGVVRTATTSSFGFYSFDNVLPGLSYRVGVSSRLYRFASQTIDVTSDLTDIDFVGSE